MVTMSAVTGRSRALLIGVLVLCAAVVLGLLALQSGSGGPSGQGGAGTATTVTGTADVPTPGATASPALPTRMPTGTPESTTPGPATPDPSSEPATRAPATTQAPEPTPAAGHTPSSGLPTIAESDLPPEAWDTMQLIYDGGPFPYRQDDSTFFNREGILPDQRRGYYREYTVETPGSHDRGARRIVAGEDGDLYWTDDHYDSFRQIMEMQ